MRLAGGCGTCSGSGIIGTFAVPALKSVLRGSALNTGANMLMDEVNLARQHALTKSRIVEFRIYRFGDPEVPGESLTSPVNGQFRAFQFFEVSDSAVVLPVGKFKRLPDTIVMNTGLVTGFTPYSSTSLSSLIAEEMTASPTRLRTPVGDRVVVPSGRKRNATN